MTAEKDIVIFDLDGTLALIEHRVHHITGEKKDWTAFYAACPNDLPNAPIIAITRALALQGYELWVVSGRSDEVAEQTMTWLKLHVGDFHKLIMRKAGDHQPDDKLKRSWIEDGTIPQERVLVVFEDRASVVKMWRELGLTCLQVAPGDF
jgi:phosphoglycolate phosphatase-like HAD superfamily hydrolase